MNTIAEYKFLLGQYCRLVAEKKPMCELEKILRRLDELWESMTEEEQRRIWR